MRRHFLGRLDDLAGGERPFFLWLHLMDPHEPLRAHPRLPPDAGADGLPELERLYREETRHAVDELAAMLEAMAERGLLRDTALVLVSDHGQMFPDGPEDDSPQRRRQRRYGHGHALYGELVRVPLVIRPPGGLAADRRIDVLTSHTDLHDTIADLLGLDLDRVGRDRMSLAPWLAPQPAEDATERGWALIGSNRHGPPQRAIRSRRLKLIEHPGGERSPELYDLLTDPGEQHDLSTARPRALERQREQLRRVPEELGETPDSRPVEIYEETRRQLEALGYVG